MPQCTLQWLLHPFALPGKVQSASSLTDSTDPIPTWGLIFQYFSLHCIYLFFMYTCVCVRVGAVVYTGGGQKTSCTGQFSPSIMWALGIELSSSGLVLGAYDS